MNITSTDIPRHTKEEALADAVVLKAKAAQDTDKEITTHVHTALPHQALLEKGQFTGYIIIRS